jgi:hypothetical protein
MLGERIRPAIAERLPLLDARSANEVIERGGVTGRIVMAAGPPREQSRRTAPQARRIAWAHRGLSLSA